MIKSAVRRRNLVTTSKVANPALEIGAIMVKRTKFNINEYRPKYKLLNKVFGACDQCQESNFRGNGSNWVCS